MGGSYVITGNIFNPLVGKFPDIPDKNLKGLKRSRKICTLLIGQSHFDQLQPCKSDLKAIWQQHLHSTAKVPLLMDIKTVQVAGNGVTMRGYPWGNSALLWQWILALERAGTPRKTVTRLTRICIGSLWRAESGWLTPSAPEWNRLLSWRFCGAKYCLLSVPLCPLCSLIMCTGSCHGSMGNIHDIWAYSLCIYCKMCFLCLVSIYFRTLENMVGHWMPFRISIRMSEKRFWTWKKEYR